MNSGLLFFQPFKIVLVAVLIYAIIFMLLKKTGVLGDSKQINSLIALISAVLVAFSGVVTYAISYMVTWFVIIFFLFFLFLILFIFLGGKIDVFSKSMSNPKTALIILGIFLVLFLGIFLKSFFALNNAFSNNPALNNSITSVNTSTNYGFETSGIGSFFINIGNYFSGINQSLLASVIFLLIIAGAVFLIK